MTAGTDNKQSFESALAELRGYSEKMQQRDLTLEETIECYEKGMACYERCRSILENARQKVDFVTDGEE